LYAEAGHGDHNIVLPLQRSIYVGKDAEDAYHTPRDNVMWYQHRNASRMASSDQVAASYEYYQRAQSNLLRTQYDDMITSGAFVTGTADSVVSQIKLLERELDLNYLICWMNIGGLPQAEVLASMERFARDVMPAFGPTVLEGSEVKRSSKGTASATLHT
jgi:hypothetical protein